MTDQGCRRRARKDQEEEGRGSAPWTVVFGRVSFQAPRISAHPPLQEIAWLDGLLFTRGKLRLGEANWCHRRAGHSRPAHRLRSPCRCARQVGAPEPAAALPSIPPQEVAAASRQDEFTGTEKQVPKVALNDNQRGTKTVIRAHRLFFLFGRFVSTSRNLF